MIIGVGLSVRSNSKNIEPLVMKFQDMLEMRNCINLSTDLLWRFYKPLIGTFHLARNFTSPAVQKGQCYDNMHNDMIMAFLIARVPVAFLPSQGMILMPAAVLRSK